MLPLFLCQEFIVASGEVGAKNKKNERAHSVYDKHPGTDEEKLFRLVLVCVQRRIISCA